MEKGRRQFLSHLVSGTTGGALALTIPPAFRYGASLLLGNPAKFRFTNHIMTQEQIEKEFKNEGKTNQWYKKRGVTNFMIEEAKAENGYLEIAFETTPRYSKIDVIDNNRNDYLLKNGLFRDFPLFKTRSRGAETFIFHVKDNGKNHEWEEKVAYLENNTLLKRVIEDANTHDNWKPRSSSISETEKSQHVPREYDITIGNVHYKIHKLDLLTDGNRKTFEETWKHKVTHA